MHLGFKLLRRQNIILSALIGLFACSGCDDPTGLKNQLASLARSGERATTDIPRETMREVDRISRERLEEGNAILTKNIGLLGDQTKIVIDMVDERLLSSREYRLKSAARRTLIKACGDNLGHEQMLDTFAEEYQATYIPLVPRFFVLSTNNVLINVLEDGTVDAQPISLSGYGFDRVVSTDDWLIQLKSRGGDQSEPIEKIVTLTEKSPYSASIELRRVLEQDDLMRLGSGEFDLIIKNRYSLDEPVTVKASVAQGVLLPTKVITFDNATFPLPLMDKTSWGFSVFDTDNGPKQVIGGAQGMYGKIPRRVFMIPPSDNGNFWGTAMVSFEAELTYNQSSCELVIVATASVVEWKRDGTGPQDNYTGGQLTQVFKKVVELAPDEEVFGIATGTDTVFGETRLLIGDGSNLKIDATNSTLVKHVEGPIIRKHDSLPGYSTLNVEFHPIKVSVCKKRN